MSVADYILLGRSPHIGYFGFEKVQDHQICADLLERLDLARMARRSLATLSGGELQRLVLGRALAQEAPVLLLDEPTSALDLGRRVDALEIVDAVRREHGLTVLSAMHDLTLAGQFADRLILLAHGRRLRPRATGRRARRAGPHRALRPSGAGAPLTGRRADRGSPARAMTGPEPQEARAVAADAGAEGRGSPRSCSSTPATARASPRPPSG